MSSRSVVRLLDHDPELGEDLADERARRASQIRAASVDLPTGYWSQPEWPAGLRVGVGLLVLDGLLLRRLHVDGRFGGELLGRGDLLRPWQREDSLASVSCGSAWRVLEPARIALLDVDFARRIAPYPEIHGRLLGRAIARSRNLAVNLAIVHQPKVDARLAVLLWHLADRWGKVRPDGVYLPLRLTHAVLAELVAARRPTVTGALHALEQRGEISCEEPGWVLHGTAPHELGGAEASPDWEAAAATVTAIRPA